LTVKPALVGVVTAVLIARPAGAGAADAIHSAARDVAEAAVMDVTEVEGPGAVGVVARAVGPLEAAVAVADESLVQDGSGAALGGPAAERVGFDFEVEPDDFRAEWGEPAVGSVWFQVEWGEPEVDQDAFAVGLAGSPAAWGGWAELPGDCLDERWAGLGGQVARLVDRDDFQVGLVEWAELLVDQGD